MALAPFFAKAAQSASQILSGFDINAFSRALVRSPVAIAWDGLAAESTEGRATLDLVVDLCARLYPELRFVPLEAAAAGIVGELTDQARAINPDLCLGNHTAGAAVAVVVGGTPLHADNTAPAPATVIYAGSDGWTLALSRGQPVGCGASANIFGASGAACLAAANVFRAVFHEQLPNGALDADIAMSLIDMAPRHNAERDACGGEASLIDNPKLPVTIDIGEAHLVGVGAIGHATVWALRRTRGLRGTLHLVDGESYDDTNPQRYVGTSHDQRGPKATTAARAPWLSNEFTVLPDDRPWSQYIADFSKQRGDWRLDRVALAVDTAADRVRVQAALPRRIHNAWTQPENIGVSRHDFLEGPCVCCLYVPRGPKANFDDIVSDALRIHDPIERKKVRFYLDTGASLDGDALAWIGDRLGLQEELRAQLAGFLGKSLQALYTRGICGGALLALNSGGRGARREVEVPIAFQSALAGVLLAAELVIDAAHLRATPLMPRTEINMLRPLGGTLNSPQQRPADGGCLCQDDDYLSAYRAKYGAE